jgi:serine/threonine protein kinase
VQVRQTHLAFSNQPLFSSQPTSAYRSSRGDVLHQAQYRLTEQVALPENQQNQGTAWLALDTLSHRRVVIREIPPRPGFRNLDAEKIHLTATRLAEMNKQHHDIPAVLDVFKERGNFYFVLEHREGNSLASLMQHQEGILPERILAEYGRQLCELLSAFSQSNLPFVHGSISPNTILISPDGANASLIHFPIFQAGELPPSKLSGHPGYLAPEQVHGIVDPSSDLYSLSASLYHAVTGSDPTDRVAFFNPPARRLNPAVTKTMEAILARGLHLSPAQRYPDPVTMQQDLEALIASYPDPTLELAAPTAQGQILTLSAEQMHERRRSNNLLDAGVVASIVVLLLVAFLFFFLR